MRQLKIQKSITNRSSEALDKYLVEIGRAPLISIGVGALIAAVIMLLATAMEGWLAALIVSVVLFAVAGILALTGKKQVEQATPPAPEQAIDSVKTDVDEIKQRARDRKSVV